MPQFDIVKSKTQRAKQKIIWKGFVVPPSKGTVGVNDFGDDQEERSEIKRARTQFAPVPVEKMRTEIFSENGIVESCEGCFVKLREANWNKDGQPYCAQCIKFRVYQECVRKFVLEYDNEETRDDLWPWYENSKNQHEHEQYKEVLDLYIDKVLSIGNIRDSNLKYYVPRQHTLDAAKCLVHIQ